MEQGSAFLVKSQIVNVLSFAGQQFQCNYSTQCGHCSVTATMDHVQTNEQAMFE